MNRVSTLATLCLFLCACVIPPSPPLEKGGGGGFKPPTRIISLKPNITEILFALGVGDKVIGVTTWCDHPPEVRSLPKIADYININTERIIALKPDLVIGSEENSLREPFKALEGAGIRTLLLPFRTMNDLYGSIEKIAEAVGKNEDGARLVNKIRLELSNTPHPAPSPPPARRRSSGGRGEGRGEGETNVPTHERTNARVLILVGHRPLVAAGGLTFYNDIINLIGAKNIVGNSAVPYPTLSTEFILAGNPDVIIDLAMGSEAKDNLPEALRDRVKTFNMSEFRAGPRIGEAVKKLTKVFSKTYLPPRPNPSPDQ